MRDLPKTRIVKFKNHVIKQVLSYSKARTMNAKGSYVSVVTIEGLEYENKGTLHDECVYPNNLKTFVNERLQLAESHITKMEPTKMEIMVETLGFK